ncbi:hypothetical protein MUK42_13970 [Musa troglodytarum]|uniref:Uncharacterized protein n=1 Tax=Musa troglodytarum TaxID=320322 RepID=A0A9E7KPZ8_9LILI|nr:hypothetical protein MUK42_13970 [Musa troglodytarum]
MDQKRRLRMAVLLALLISFSPGADSRVGHLLTGAARDRLKELQPVLISLAADNLFQRSSFLFLRAGDDVRAQLLAGHEMTLFRGRGGDRLLRDGGYPGPASPAKNPSPGVHH